MTRNRCGSFHVWGPNHKPSSVLLLPIQKCDDHLSGMRVTTHLKRRSRTMTGTALRGGKDLAVSAVNHFTDTLRRESVAFRHPALLFAPRVSRRTGVTRYLAALSSPSSDFPLQTQKGTERSSGSVHFQLYHVYILISIYI